MSQSAGNGDYRSVDRV